MEYFRDPKNQIYADMAYRIGRIVVQYENLVEDDNKFESTLNFIALQNLLTNGQTYIDSVLKDKRFDYIFKQCIHETEVWGISQSCVCNYTFYEKMTLENIIRKLRNAVSHPTPIDISSEFCGTGYTTLISSNGKIEKYSFINSPDTKNNRQKIFKNEDEIHKYVARCVNEFPKDIEFHKTDEKYVLYYENKPFARFAKIELSIEQISDLVKRLANFLAQPIQENWDGKTIKNLIAA